MATYLQGKPGIYKITNTATGIIYSSLAEVCDLLNITKGSMSRKLLGKRINKTTFKYI
jgi:lipopolysaccharide/colanic/teichoic acid biosynthesis glycosyltransferase